MSAPGSLTPPSVLRLEPTGVYDPEGRKLSETVTLTVDRLNAPRRIEPAYEGVVQVWIHGSPVGVFEDGWDVGARLRVQKFNRGRGTEYRLHLDQPEVVYPLPRGSGS